jgi:hypothetical protein
MADLACEAETFAICPFTEKFANPTSKPIFKFIYQLANALLESRLFQGSNYVFIIITLAVSMMTFMKQ